MKLFWTLAARADLRDILGYIAANNPAKAREVVGRIREYTDNLTEFPRMGREGRSHGTRELVIPKLPYLVVYTLIDEATLHVLRVWHARRRFPERF